jgi:nucleotide-binding universal stress UspA family protein
MFRHILVPTDGSPLSTRAVKFAVKLAKSSAARITAFHVIPAFQLAAYMDGMIAPYPELYSEAEYKRATDKETRRMLAKAAEVAKAAKVSCKTHTTYAELPWKAIIRTAKSKGCDLIVMASHGRRGIKGVLLGSETTKVLTHSKIPVLVCR